MIKPIEKLPIEEAPASETTSHHTIPSPLPTSRTQPPQPSKKPVSMITGDLALKWGLRKISSRF